MYRHRCAPEGIRRPGLGTDRGDKKTLEPMFKNIMKNQVLLNDLFSLTEHDFGTYAHSINVGIFATSLAIHFYQGDGTIRMENLERQSYGIFFTISGNRDPPSHPPEKGTPYPGRVDHHEKTSRVGIPILMETGT